MKNVEVLVIACMIFYAPNLLPQVECSEIDAPGLDYNVCNVSQTGSQIPMAQLPKDFSTVIEWKLVNSNITVSVHEYHSAIAKKTALFSTKSDGTTQIIFDNSGISNQILRLTKAYNQARWQCNLEAQSYLVPYFVDNEIWFTTTNDLYEHYGLSRNAIYHGKTTIREIGVDHFSSCGYDPYTNMTTRMDVYYAWHGWALPYTPPSQMAMVRIELKTSQNFGDITHVIGDYFDFSPTPNFDVEKLQPPSGVYCDKLISQSVTFNIVPSFSVTFEVIDIKQQQISYQKTWFDSSNQLVRRDYKVNGGNDPDPVTEIYDFNRGLLYKIDKYLGTCDEPYIISAANLFVQTDPDQATISMAPGSTIFYSDPIVSQQIGTRLTRGVYCNVYSGIYFDKTVQRNVTVEWYFAQTSWVEAGGFSETTGPLMRFDIWQSDNEDQPVVYHVHNYDSTPPPLDVFDLGNCFKYTQKLRFVIDFKVSNNSRMTNFILVYVLETIHLRLSSELEIDLVQISEPEIVITDTHEFYFVATLLDPSNKKNPFLPPSSNAEVHNKEAAYNFLNGAVTGRWSTNLRTRNGINATATAVGISQIDFQAELTTPRPKIISTPPNLVPTLPSSTISTPEPTPPPPGQKTSTSKPATSRLPTPKTATPIRTTVSQTTASPTTTSSTTFTTTSSTLKPSNAQQTVASHTCPTVTCPPVKCPSHTFKRTTPYSSFSLAPKQEKIIQKKGLSAGGVAGISITLFIVGVVTGVFALKLYILKTKRPSLTAQMDTEY